MLVVVEDGDVDTLLQLALDVEALGRLDVFQVDAAEGGGNHLAKANDLVGSLALTSMSKTSTSAKRLKSTALPSMTGLRGQRAAVAQAENGRTIADDGDQVALGRVVVGKLGMIGDLEHGKGNARRIGQRQIALGVHRLGGHDFQLAWSSLGMIVE